MKLEGKTFSHTDSCLQYLLLLLSSSKEKGCLSEQMTDGTWVIKRTWTDVIWMHSVHFFPPSSNISWNLTGIWDNATSFWNVCFRNCTIAHDVPPYIRNLVETAACLLTRTALWMTGLSVALSVFWASYIYISVYTSLPVHTVSLSSGRKQQRSFIVQLLSHCQPTVASETFQKAQPHTQTQHLLYYLPCVPKTCGMAKIHSSPAYQRLQVRGDGGGVGSNMTIWDREDDICILDLLKLLFFLCSCNLLVPSLLSQRIWSTFRQPCRNVWQNYFACWRLLLANTRPSTPWTSWEQLGWLLPRSKVSDSTLEWTDPHRQTRKHTGAQMMLWYTGVGCNDFICAECLLN